VRQMSIDKQNWSQTPLETRQELFRRAAAHDAEALHGLLELVRAPGGFGVYASVGPNYQFAIFGRDSIAFAEDILTQFPDISREIIEVLARLQGRRTDPITEEEPGKIHHEYRALHFNGETISETAKRVYDLLLPRWGHPETQELLYYGSVDATPLFIQLVDLYVARNGADLLDHAVTHHSGQATTIRQAVEQALDWLLAKIAASPWGLLEFKRLNPQGLLNQAWKDSDTAYLHTDGSVANADGGIASVEVQGYAYDALQAVSRLLPLPPERAEEVTTRAHQLAKQTMELMWLPENQFFAMGLDRGSDGNTRQIKTLTSNAAVLLKSGLLDAIDPSQAKSCAAGVATRIMNDTQFLTPAGIRARSLQHASLLAYADYHGSQVTWPKDTLDVARALRKWGFHRQADELEQRVVRYMQLAGEAYEFFYVNTENQVKVHYRLEHPNEPRFHDFGAANTPEPGQAWSLSSFACITGRQPLS
jgi:glycogen debranching enzyme